MEAQAISRALKRLASEIVERNNGLDEVCLVGVYTRGVGLSKRLKALLEKEEGVDVPIGTNDRSMFHFDASKQVASQISDVP